MSDLFLENVRLRIAYLGVTWEELAKAHGENPSNVRAWVRRGAPRSETLRRLAEMLGVPPHSLLDPAFNPREYPPPVVTSEEKGSDG